MKKIKTKKIAYRSFDGQPLDISNLDLKKKFNQHFIMKEDEVIIDAERMSRNQGWLFEPYELPLIQRNAWWSRSKVLDGQPTTYKAKNYKYKKKEEVDLLVDKKKKHLKK